MKTTGTSDVGEGFWDRIDGGVYGLLIGDALGVPYEFHPPSAIPPMAAIEMQPPIGFSRAHVGTPVGTWSDDGAQALALLDSLITRGGFDARDFADRLVAWQTRGEYTPDSRVFDIGIQTSRALASLRSGVEPLLAGGTDEFSNGNGSLMRVLPLALFHAVHRSPDSELIADAHAQSRVTHAHPRSQVCCALYCLWAKNALFQTTSPFADAARTLRAAYENDPVRRGELETHVWPGDAPGCPRGTGYVVDCLRSAVAVQAPGEFEATVKNAVALGHDTDTTACVAGGIAGIASGLSRIPARWLGELQGKSLVDRLLARLRESAGAATSS